MSKNLIYITGMAKGGTTLVKSLFNCFHNTHVVPGDRDVPCTLPRNIPAANIVVKGLHLGRDIPYFKSRGFRSMLVLRDIRDQITSSWSDPSVHGKRYVTTRQGKELRGLLEHLFLVVLTYDYLAVRYEDVCQEPEEFQRKIAEYFDLSARCSFGEGYKYFGEYSDSQDKVLYENDQGALKGGFDRPALRPVDTRSIGQWREHPCRDFVLQFLEDAPDAQKYLDTYYPETD